MKMKLGEAIIADLLAEISAQWVSRHARLRKRIRRVLARFRERGRA